MRLESSPRKQEFIKFAGGLDTETPEILKRSGYVSDSQNYEEDINEGYMTIKGYEAYDGKAKPSDAAYAVLTCTITGSVSVGDVLTDNATTSYGTVIALPTGQAVLTLITGTFSTGNIKVGGVVVGTCTGAQVVDGAATAILHAQYKNLAADVYRALIAAVPGSGSILGVWAYYDPVALTENVYAFRNAVGGATAKMYKSTASGWSEISLNNEISFSNANTGMADGDTLTQGAITATILRVVVETGTLASGVNTGRFIIGAVTGGPFAAGAATDGGAGAVTLGGAESAITLLPDGRYEFITETFGGGTNTAKVYGCDGVNRGFEFDGTVFVPIDTGMVDDTPRHICAHKNHLFFSFDASVQHSGIGTPYMFTVISGASEIAMGDTVTGFIGQAGSSTEGALTITTKNKLATLYGSSSSDWNLISYRKEVGAIEHTLQQIGSTVFLTDVGFVLLQAVQEFGNFADHSISQLIKSYMDTKYGSVTASCIMRKKAQYRIFFSDKTALYVTMKPATKYSLEAGHFMPVLLADKVECICSVENSSGTEVVYFGDDQGYVYQMEKGTSLDGEDIDAFINLAYDNCKSPGVDKAFKSGTLEVKGTGYSEINVGYSLGYGDSDIIQASSENQVLSLGAITYDAGYTYDSNIYYDSLPLRPVTFQIEGTATNISMRLTSRSDYYSQTKFSGIMLQYIPRRLRLA